MEVPSPACTVLRAGSSAPVPQIAHPRCGAVSSDPVHLPGRRHAIRRRLCQQSSCFPRRIPPRLYSLLQKSRSASRRPPLRRHAPDHSSRPRTRPFLRLPPPSHSLQLPLLHSLPIAHRHVRRFHPDALTHPHHPCPFRRRRLRPARRIRLRRSRPPLRRSSFQHRPRDRLSRSQPKYRDLRDAAASPPPRCPLSSWRQPPLPPPAPGRPRRLGRPLRHHSKSPPCRTTRRRPHPPLR